MTRYEELIQKQKYKEKPKQTKSSLFSKIIFVIEGILLLIMFIALINLYLFSNEANEGMGTSETSTLDLSKNHWTEEQKRNIQTVYEQAVALGHPKPKRVIAHLLAESSAKFVKDGDIINGAFKKSYGIMQVKLGTVYYVKNKRPDLVKLYISEINVLPKEDILHKLRTDPIFNARVGTLTHTVMTEVCGNDMDRGSVAYNRGFCEADAQGRQYLTKIKKFESMV